MARRSYTTMRKNADGSVTRRTVSTPGTYLGGARIREATTYANGDRTVVTKSQNAEELGKGLKEIPVLAVAAFLVAVLLLCYAALLVALIVAGATDLLRRRKAAVPKVLYAYTSVTSSLAGPLKHLGRTVARIEGGK